VLLTGRLLLNCNVAHACFESIRLSLCECNGVGFNFIHFIAFHLIGPLACRIGEQWRVHLAEYPTLYHYDMPDIIPESFPVFALGRNPYTRVLSGFLDKMTEQSHRGNDWDTLRMTNIGIGRGEGAGFFEATQDGFREFLQLLTAQVMAGKRVNEHFAPMVDVCNMAQVPYHYMLRLEDMSQWYPCFRQGLNLHHFTDSGWDHERNHRSDWYSPHNTGCWWSPAGVTCDEYQMKADEFVVGQRANIRASGTDPNDVHSTNADEQWRLFYDQRMADMVYDTYIVDFKAFGYERVVIDEDEAADEKWLHSTSS
jgi:hypothetical protein